jgi:hypothetical protein
MTGIYVLTCRRKTEGDPWRYLRAAIKQAEGEEIDHPLHVIVDGTDDDCAEVQAVAPGWIVHRFDRGPNGNRSPITGIHGNKWPYWHMLKVATETTLPGDEAILLEDDLQFGVNALTRMLTFRVPANVDILQFFSGFLFKTPNAWPGLWRSPAPFLGCQAVKFPRRTLVALTEWGTDPEWQKYNDADMAIGLAQERLSLRIAHHIPDIVQHIGDISAVEHMKADGAGINEGPGRQFCDTSLGMGRTSVNFTGEFDCMRLFAYHWRFR